MSTRVDFYVLTETAQQARDLTACRIIEKAWLKDNRVYVHADSLRSAERLNDLLWSFRQGSFVPHELCNTPLDESVPVLIGHGECPSGLSAVLVNLDQTAPGFFSQFDRVVELIATSEDAKLAGRARWRHYKEYGCEMYSHNV